MRNFFVKSITKPKKGKEFLKNNLIFPSTEIKFKEAI